MWQTTITITRAISLMRHKPQQLSRLAFSFDMQAEGALGSSTQNILYFCEIARKHECPENNHEHTHTHTHTQTQTQTQTKIHGCRNNYVQHWHTYIHRVFVRTVYACRIAYIQVCVMKWRWCIYVLQSNRNITISHQKRHNVFFVKSLKKNLALYRTCQYRSTGAKAYNLLFLSA